MSEIYKLRNNQRYRVSFRVNSSTSRRIFRDFNYSDLAINFFYNKYLEDLKPQIRIVEL